MNNLEKAQYLNRIIMRKIHKLCKKYNITYFLDSGALIGAVRHKSFIPWDDDVDIVFTREEYEKFLAIPKEEWGEDFEVVTCEKLVNGGFFDFITRVIYHKDTVPLAGYNKAGEYFNKEYENKIGVDCFVFENAYDSMFMQKLLLLRLYIVYGQLMGHRQFIDYAEYSLIQRVVIFFLSHIGRLRDVRKLKAKYMRLTRSVKKPTGYYFYSNYPMYLMWARVKKEWFDSTIPVQIDEDWFDGPVGYHEVLVNQYGDYMKLPPEEKRVPQHVVLEENV